MFKWLAKQTGLTLTSRRERMTYVLMVLWFIFGIICVCTKVNLVEATSYYGAVAMLAGWYLQKETDKESQKPM